MTDIDSINKKITKHNIHFVKSTEDIKNKKHWYKCSFCGKEDWILNYESFSELNFYYEPCKKLENQNDNSK